MRIQVTVSRQVYEYLKSSSEECRSAFREFEELLKKHIPSVPGEVIFAKGFSDFPLRTGELIGLKRQIKKGWMGEVHLINISHIVSAEKHENFVVREMGNSQDTSGLNLENQNPLNQIVIGSLDQAGRFDILLKVLKAVPIIFGLVLTGLIAITESQGLTNMLPNKQNPPPSQLEKPPQPD